MVTMMMKRQRESEEKESIDLATSLILLSGATKGNKPFRLGAMEFECKTCNRKFSSFQALGGHRASHKKPKFDGEEAKALSLRTNKPKLHECSICGQEFSLGQALGGHMRKHRGDGFSSINQAIAKTPVLKRSNSSKRVMSLEMDLNLTPLENDLKLLFGKKAPQLDLSLF